jgi:hypothetical protein
MLAMPTPFMHLAAAHRFLTDSDVPPFDKLSTGNLGAFLLGNVAPDARVSSGLRRAETHFFEYAAKVNPPAGEAMLAAFPQLKMAEGSQRAFIAGYLAHLAMDVVWTEDMLFPHFYQRDWASRMTRYEILHVLLCYLDTRDYRRWGEDYGDALAGAQPHDWLPFLPDADLADWRDVIARQVCGECESATLSVLGARVTIGQEGLQAILDNPQRMQTELWDHVPLSLVAEVEAKMYLVMKQQLIDYLSV